MSTSYSADYEPPIPVVSITFAYGDASSHLGPFDAIVDSGADATIVPERIPQQLRAIPLNPGQLITQWGDVHPITIYLLDVEINGQSLPGVIVAGDPESDEVILGRNVLNKLALLLDGPEQQTEILQDVVVNRLRAQRK